jgi:hypothetical protein
VECELRDKGGGAEGMRKGLTKRRMMREEEEVEGYILRITV